MKIHCINENDTIHSIILLYAEMSQSQFHHYSFNTFPAFCPPQTVLCFQLAQGYSLQMAHSVLLYRERRRDWECGGKWGLPSHCVFSIDVKGDSGRGKLLSVTKYHAGAQPSSFIVRLSSL